MNPYTSRPCTFKKTTEYLLSAELFCERTWRSARWSTRGGHQSSTSMETTSRCWQICLLLDNSALRVLSLESNGLRNVQKGVFYPLVYLEELILDRNNITCLLSYIFGRNKNLKLVQLSSNNFNSIPIRAFASLQTLNLILLNYNPRSAFKFQRIFSDELIYLRFTNTSKFRVSK